jgi:hypothetical protein
MEGGKALSDWRYHECGTMYAGGVFGIYCPKCEQDQPKDVQDKIPLQNLLESTIDDMMEGINKLNER